MKFGLTTVFFLRFRCHVISNLWLTGARCSATCYLFAIRSNTVVSMSRGRRIITISCSHLVSRCATIIAVFVITPFSPLPINSKYNKITLVIRKIWCHLSAIVYESMLYTKYSPGVTPDKKLSHCSNT